MNKLIDESEIIKSFQLIIEEIKSKDFLNDTELINRLVSTSNSSTAVRVLLSDDFYEAFKDRFDITNALSKFVYRIYQKDSKTIKANLSDEQLRSFFKNERPIKNEEEKFIWSESFWQLDEKYNTVRKEGIKLTPKNGFFLQKEFINEDIILSGNEFQNIELIHPTHRINQSEDLEDNYHWIIGKYPLIEDYTIRFYWNFNPIENDIKDLLKEIQDKFDESKIPFEFKILAKVNEYANHSDVGVLYLPRKHSLISFEIVRDIYNQFKHRNGFFSNKSPLFTFKLGDETDFGLSFGENPDDKRYTSFGSYRAIHIAMSIMDYVKSNTSLPNANQLYDFINLKYPNWLQKFYINQYSYYDYNQEIKFFKTKGLNHTKNIFIDDLATSKKLNKICLSVAVKIAHILTKEAFWYQNTQENTNKYYYPLQATWISFKAKSVKEGVPDDNFKETTNIGIEYGALDESFLEGRLGPAFFLRQVHRVSKDESFYRTFYRTVKGVIDIYKEKGILINKEETYWLWRFFMRGFKEIYKDIKESPNYSEISELFHDYKNRKIEQNASMSLLRFIKDGWEVIKSNEDDSLDKDIIRQTFKFNRKKNAWRNETFTILIDKVLTQERFDLNTKDEELIKIMIKDYFNIERPFGNALGTDEFCVTIKDGYAALGYFFLRLYNPRMFKALPFNITYV